MRYCSFILAAILPFLFSCSQVLTVTVTNPADLDRETEMVEISLDKVTSALGLEDGETFVVRSSGQAVPYQVTYDGKVIFPVTLKAGASESYKITEGTPDQVTEQVRGDHYPRRVDDICWENDLIGFRVYGFKEDKPSGYDIFVKRNTELPAIPEMYRRAFDPQLKKVHKQLKKADKDSADRFNCDHISFHVDHGFGADCYGVGPTLGAGTNALVDEGTIVYPYCYDSFRILDNGPLRFTIELTFRPFKYGESENVVETRVISLDLGSYFNRTIVQYANLDKPAPIVTGIVLQDKDGKAVGNASEGYIAYPAPTINYDKQREVDNGTIYVGHVYPGQLDKAEIVYFSDEESKNRGNAKGHVLASSNYDPKAPFVYYWGAGWNHSQMKSYEQWTALLEKFSAQLRNPINITVN
jgi:hypothetical protein